MNFRSFLYDEHWRGPNLTKAETMIENMADGEGKIVAQKETARWAHVARI